MSASAPTSGRWQRVEEIYHAALEHDIDTRIAFIQRECQGDTELEREVETLLATEGKGGVLDHPAIEFAPELLAEEAPLRRGTELGPFRIEGSVGSGGMGRVYRAQDTRLNRTVALKISRQEFSARFEREARAVASLNHANICQLYDIGPNYLVMEYVEGQPLRGPLPVDRAVQYGTQILDALDAAHRRGVVHRDLKPANILVAKQGIKLLDFGLAKQIESNPVEITITNGLTAAGTILGTIQYMSPEQLQGKTADARSDLFSFGCVLYEMLTGKRAFEGENPASVIAAVLQREPAPIQISPPLDRIVDRCLAKDPDQRFQTAADLRTALAWAAEERLQAAPKIKQRWIAAAGLCIATLGVALWAPWRKATTETPDYAFALDTVEGGGYMTGFSLSPDGRTVAVSTTDLQGQRSLRVRKLNSVGWHLVPGGEAVPAASASWSADGKQLAYAVNSKVRKIDLASGTVQTLSDHTSSGPPFTGWSANNQVVYSRWDGLWRVPASGGGPVQLTAIDPKRHEQYHHIAQFLPDGHHFLYIIASRQPANTGIFLGSVDGSPDANRRFIMTARYSVLYAPGPNGSGYILFEREGALMAQQFDTNELRLTGEPVMVLPKIDMQGTRPAVSLSTNGVMAYSKDLGSYMTTQLTWFTRDGRRIENIGPPTRYASYSLAPDGKRLAVHKAERDDSNVWILDPARNNVPLRLTLDSGTNPIWSADGRYVAYVNRKDGSANYRRRADGAGPEEKLGSAIFTITDWARDGNIFGQSMGRMLMASGSNLVQLTKKPDVTEQYPVVSPDGKWLAYTSDESKRQNEVYVRSMSADDLKYQVSTGGGVRPRWRADGKELFFLGEDGKLMAVPVKSGAAFEYGTPVVLFKPPVPETPGTSGYVVSPDGQRFLFRTIPTGANSGSITVVSNWFAAVRQ